MPEMDRNRKYSGIWWIIGVMIFLGIVLIVFFSFTLQNNGTADKPVWVTTAQDVFVSIGIMLLIGGACFGIGILLGFLFGIPRLVSQNIAPTVSNPTNSLSPQARRARAIASNDNLVQISDWLTKIIVGVGLTQLYSIPHFIRRVGDFCADSFRTGAEDRNGLYHVSEVGRNAAISTIVYFLVVGFIASYVWTRLVFTEHLNELENDLDG